MSVFDREEKTWEDLDFTRVNFKSSGESDDPEAGHWAFGRGGSPLQSHEWAISHVDDDSHETRYKMPDCISHMLNLQHKFGKEEAQRDIKHALGL
ncbi:MAG: hypothetical protein MJA29_09475 [Candidatus Omnitrophica bacterium]|nr:hypothetical protein [Candidatus Omnitrophota bacterium]